MLITFSGKSCSGKSNLAKFLASTNNLAYLSIDEIGHKVVNEEQIKNKICEAFNIPIEYFTRKKLSEIVFNNKEKMDILTDITWARMQEHIDEFISKNENVILDWILMPKSKYFEMADINFLIDVPFEERLKRAIERDGISEEKFLERESASFDYSSTSFDYIVSNKDFEIAKSEILKDYEEKMSEKGA